MTEEILQIIEERRKIRNRYGSEYNSLNRSIQKKCVAEKSRWYEEKCQEKLDAKHNYKELRAKSRYMMQTHKKKRSDAQNK